MRSLFLTDLDGTLLRSDRTIGERTLDSLERLAERQVVRVVATGRSLHSVLRVLAIRSSPRLDVDLAEVRGCGCERYNL